MCVGTVEKISYYYLVLVFGKMYINDFIIHMILELTTENFYGIKDYLLEQSVFLVVNQRKNRDKSHEKENSIR